MDISKAERIFHGALELPAGKEREAYLGAACAGDQELRNKIDRLLAAEPVLPKFMPTEPADRPTTVEAPLAEGSGTIIGRYKLLQRIGEGGMGVVYMAEQEEPIRRRVALKIIKLGMDTRSVVARFEAERQALAMMDHPNIAKVLDGGATESGRPYFVMELVQGVPITEFCDKAKFPASERLKLFIQVCQAIQSAHQKGIIHRDIKPSNVLVTLHDGVPVPKVIDFGVAKATNQRLTEKTLFTNFATMIGTPAYMSPEQAELSGLDIDTRSDIYALGVLLYELLTGGTPFPEKRLRSLGYGEMQRVILEEEPERPSTRLSTLSDEQKTIVSRNCGEEFASLRNLLRGDLDWIIMKCLEKDRQRRYETANGLAADLKRFLSDEPVAARPPSAGYRLQKTVRRNKVAFAAAGAVILALLAGLGVSLWEATKARRAEKAAEQRRLDSERARQEAQSIADFLTDVFGSPDPARDGRTVTMVETLDRGVKKLDTLMTNQPGQAARLLGTLGNTYVALGQTVKAIPVLERAREVSSTNSAPLPADALDPLEPSTDALARLYYQVGRVQDAVKSREDALSTSRRINGPNHRQTIHAMSQLALFYLAVGPKSEAIPLAEQALALSRGSSIRKNLETPLASGILAECYFQSNRKEEALKLREENLKLWTSLGGEVPDMLGAMHELADSYADAGRHAEALKLRNQLVEMSRKANGPENPVTIWAMQQVALSYHQTGHYSDELKLCEEILRLRTKVNGPEHPDTIAAMRQLANCYSGVTGRWNDALRLREQILQTQTMVFGSNAPDTAFAVRDVSCCYADLGQHEKVIDLRQRTLAILRGVYGPEHEGTLYAMGSLADAYADSGRPKEAIELLEAVLKGRRKSDGSDKSYSTDEKITLVGAFMHTDQKEGAAKLLSEAAADDKLEIFSLCKVALLQAWFGMHAQYEQTRENAIRRAANTDKLIDASYAARLACLRPIPDPIMQAKSLALAQRAVDLVQPDPWLFLHQLVLGMAEFRSGRLSEAEQTFLAAEKGAQENADGPCAPAVRRASQLYRVMILLRQDKAEGAQRLFEEATAAMRPLPADPNSPFLDGASYEDVIMWLAFKEASSLLKPASSAL